MDGAGLGAAPLLLPHAHGGPAGPTAPCRAWSPSAVPGSVIFHHLQHRGWCPGWLQAVPPALGGHGDVTALLILLSHPRDGVRGFVRVTQSRRGTERAAVGTHPLLPPIPHRALSLREQGDKGALGAGTQGCSAPRTPVGTPSRGPVPSSLFLPGFVFTAFAIPRRFPRRCPRRHSYRHRYSCSQQ